MLDDIDKHFSVELLALMGEWSVYYSISYYNEALPKSGFEENRYNELMTDEERFTQRLDWHHLYDHFYEFYETLWGFGLIKNDSDYDSDGKLIRTWERIIGEYNNVRGTALNAIRGKAQGLPKEEPLMVRALFPIFIENLQRQRFHYHNVVGTSEKFNFTIEEGCKPLVGALIAEGFLHENKSSYNWTEKIRPMMEATKAWLSPEAIEEQKILSAKRLEAEMADEEILFQKIKKMKDKSQRELYMAFWNGRKVDREKPKPELVSALKWYKET